MVNNLDPWISQRRRHSDSEVARHKGCLTFGAALRPLQAKAIDEALKFVFGKWVILHVQSTLYVELL